MIVERYDNDDNFDEKSSKRREMERNSSECNLREQNLLFSPQVYKHLLSSPLFHSRSHMENNKRNETEMVRSGSRQYSCSNNDGGGGMKRKYDDEVSI